MELIRAALFIERQFAANHYKGIENGPDLIVIRRNAPIIISAPHAVYHPRSGRLKAADSYTGALALQLAELTSMNALVYARTSDEDPNYDPDGPYKQRLVHLVRETSARFVLDIHGIKSTRPQQIILGTNYGKTIGKQYILLHTLKHMLQETGFNRVFVDEPHHLSSAHPCTIASFTARELAIPAIQIEINKQFRDPWYAPAHYLCLLYTLAASIQALTKILFHSLN